MFEECLYFNSNALARTVTRLWTEAYKPFDLSPPHAFLLRMVLAKPGLMPRELAEQLHLSRSTVSRFLDSLEKRDLLQRAMATSDGRELQVFPTPVAKALHKDLDKTGQRLTQHMRKLIGSDDLAQTLQHIRQVQDVLDDR